MDCNSTSIPMQQGYHPHQGHQNFPPLDPYHTYLPQSNTVYHRHQNHFDRYQTRVRSPAHVYICYHHRNHLIAHNHLDLLGDHLLSSVQFWYCKLVQHHHFHLQYHREHLHHYSNPVTGFLLLQILRHQEHLRLLKIAGHRYTLYHAKYHFQTPGRLLLF